jgi:hypothetical protein
MIEVGNWKLQHLCWIVYMHLQESLAAYDIFCHVHVIYKAFVGRYIELRRFDKHE